MTNDINDKDDIQVEDSTKILIRGFILGYGLALISIIGCILIFSRYIK